MFIDEEKGGQQKLSDAEIIELALRENTNNSIKI
jgi:hypothetical protein